MKFLILVSLVLLSSCSKDQDLNFPTVGRTETYKIFEGNHVAAPLEVSPIYSVYDFAVRITFNKAKYLLKDENGAISIDQQDWNKLTGFSDCNFYDAYTGMGAMVGWRWNPNQKRIELAAYVHNNADRSRHVKEFKNVYMNENESYVFRIVADEKQKKYTYTIEDPDLTSLSVKEKIVMKEQGNINEGRGCKGNPITGRLISPWFGGTQSAPTEIEIKVEYLKL
ncbi:MAG: hypothetical protein QE271_13900 [Bacteriovoracaceae bacterium]|nr:hypothetical protein [Bacteriovoracaceae bacterium]